MNNEIRLKTPQEMFQEGDDKKRVQRYQDLCTDPDFQKFINEVYAQYCVKLFSGRTQEEQASTENRRLGANEFSKLLVTFPFKPKIQESKNDGKLTY